MSKNRENVIWQSRDRKWNRGFFSYVVTGPDDEWNVEYDTHTFSWVATDLPTEDAARDAWDGANPGGYRRIPWNKENQAQISRYEKMATAFKKSGRPKRHHATMKRTRDPLQLEREIAASEIARYAKGDRAVVIQPYTFLRWAQLFPLADIRSFASANRAVKIQPYTFARWAQATR